MNPRPNTRSNDETTPVADDPENPKPDLPDWVVARLTEAFQRIQNMTAGSRLWHERFTDADRSRFDQPWPDVWKSNQGTIGLWCHARGTSWNRAIAEVAHALGFLDQQARDAIVTALPTEGRPADGLATTKTHREVRPSWNKQLGELRYRGHVIREVKAEAENLRRILDEFEVDGWPNEIYDPFPPDDASDRRRRAVATLNTGLNGIRFFSTGSGRRIGWSPVDDDRRGSALTA